MSTLSTAERRSHALRVLQDEGHVSVADLSRALDVSEVTIRKDLKYLEARNLLVRTHGGALAPHHLVRDLPVEEKAVQNVEEKRRIGRAAVALVDDGDRIILDSGSTTLEVARNLRDKRNLTVTTSSVLIAGELLHTPEIELLMLGGPVRPMSASIVGPYAEQILRDHSFTKLFLAVDGFDLRYGLTTINALEAHLNRIMIAAAQQTIVVTDATKFNQRGMSRICGIEEVHTVITDRRVPDAAVRTLEERGTQVIIV